MACRLVVVFCALLAAHTLAAQTQVPVIGGPCEGCEAVFAGLPSNLQMTGHIAPAGEAGEPMRIDGVVRDRQGRPVPGIIVYAYQTDAKGVYPAGDRALGATVVRHGRLRSWARTDEAGRYRFETIRPGGYPGTDIPQHVHLHVIEPGRGTYYIDDIVFEDDPRLTPAQRRSHSAGRGGLGVVKPVRDQSGRWLVTRDIILGQGIPGYPAR